jgi:lysophospholipase L1-like esterase
MIIVLFVIPNGSLAVKPDNPGGQVDLYKEQKSLFAVNKPQVINIVMLGNSITSMADWNELLSRTDIANRGIGGDTTEGFLNRLTEDIFAFNPKICFIMGGLNDFSRGVPVNKVYINYIEILKELKAKGITPIIQSTLYVSKTIHNWRELNKKVDKLNKKLKEYAYQESIVFIDLNSELSRKGALDTIYTSDGLHLLGSGYVKWRDLILSTLTENKINFKNN